MEFSELLAIPDPAEQRIREAVVRRLSLHGSCLADLMNRMPDVPDVSVLHPIVEQMADEGLIHRGKRCDGFDYARNPGFIPYVS